MQVPGSKNSNGTIARSLSLLVLSALAAYAAHADSAETGKNFRDCPECPEMRWIPVGRYTMGSPADEGNRDKDEGPIHEVSIDHSIAVSTSEVTWLEWGACVEAGFCKSAQALDGPPDSGWGMHNRPVINVSWNDARAYAEWLQQRTGMNYGLPSEAEWEYAARANSQTPYPFGESIGNICDFANGADLATDFVDRNDTCFDGFGRETAPVRSFAPNEFGLYDMLGNVWEWTEDCWTSSYIGASNNGSARVDGDCTQRVLRGGSWGSYPDSLRSATRYGVDARYRGHEVGIRVVRRP